MNKFILIVLIIPCVAGCGTYKKFTKAQEQHILHDKKSIIYEDGISIEEAIIITNEYFLGKSQYDKDYRVKSYSTPIDRGKVWEIKVKGNFGFPYTFTKEYPFYIYKLSGYTFWKHGINEFRTIKYNNLKYEIREEKGRVSAVVEANKMTEPDDEYFRKEFEKSSYELTEYINTNLSNYIKPINKSEITFKKEGVHHYEPLVVWVANIPLEYKDETWYEYEIHLSSYIKATDENLTTR